MRVSTYPIVIGAGLFVMPVPGTFVTGAVVLVVGVLARWFGW